MSCCCPPSDGLTQRLVLANFGEEATGGKIGSQRCLLLGGYFESVAFTPDDLSRAAQYQGNAQRAVLQDSSRDLGEFLRSLEMKITPKPKRMGILSLRTPVRVYGTFRDPDFEFEKGPLALRAAAALALTAEVG